MNVEHKRICVPNFQRIALIIERGTKMKNVKRTILILVLVTFIAILSGCQAQDGGSDTKVIGWDKNGPYFLKHITNGSQVAVGKPDAANERFNVTTQKKHQQTFVKKLAEGKTPVVKNATDVTTIMSQFNPN